MIMPGRFDGDSNFDDKGEVKQLVGYVIKSKDPGVAIESLRKLDYSYVFTLSKMMSSKEVELFRPEIEASWDWRSGNIDEFLEKKIFETISEL